MFRIHRRQRTAPCHSKYGLHATQEAGRLFCPQCGNATMEKVEVTTGPDGAEQYGIRKKHNLRGTRFSLPKPKVRAFGWRMVTTATSPQCVRSNQGFLYMATMLVLDVESRFWWQVYAHTCIGLLTAWGWYRDMVASAGGHDAAGGTAGQSRCPLALGVLTLSLNVLQGGRQDGVPVLREDVMLQRMPHMRAQVAKAGVEVRCPLLPDSCESFMSHMMLVQFVSIAACSPCLRNGRLTVFRHAAQTRTL